MTSQNHAGSSFVRGDAYYPAMRVTDSNFGALSAWVRAPEADTGQSIDPDHGPEAGHFELHPGNNGPGPDTGGPGDWLLYDDAAPSFFLVTPDELATHYTRHTGDLWRNAAGDEPVWLTVGLTSGHTLTSLVWSWELARNGLTGDPTRFEWTTHPLSPHALRRAEIDSIALIYETPIDGRDRRRLRAASHRQTQDPHTFPDPLPLPDRTRRGANNFSPVGEMTSDVGPPSNPLGPHNYGGPNAYPPAAAAYEARSRRRYE